ncbi:methylthioadenosine nucleosidase /adenosylhomocysteine nucleosidase [Verrucomicrobium sp. GAS474]|uniref:5'-methylthioadenosine/S-adenosylhomocysteine nucleosidase n=1 Tax=Verrucomicrobium sp. GAS474 TaxID=1882831 RepID=UPI00087D3FDC|nr:5'-methylthioadenosine/S-adenosylhomocysteine nucleosidase [Verrucomicrobium sp. GAS474]SDU19419.1 methylthioadenosine nucleosidase /adenosylhomocysteine nucleosidase [Verrucomicrobium sp. GAS474]
MRHLSFLSLLLSLALTLPLEAAESASLKRIAVIGAFQEEIDAIKKELLPAGTPLVTTSINGTRFDEADLGGKHYVFLLSGVSMVNAAMNTQLVLDRFHVDAVFFTGIAGGVNPDLLPGDVIIPAEWLHQTESIWLNPDPQRPGKYVSEETRGTVAGHWEMIFFRDVKVVREGESQPAPMHAFPADPALLKIAAGTIQGLPLAGGKPQRLGKIVLGDRAMSGPVFLDNARFRAFAYEKWKVDAHDMESTAVAQVCWVNKTPVLIVRGLSDLAGGQAGPNEIKTYVTLAAKNAAIVTARILKAF